MYSRSLEYHLENDPNDGQFRDEGAIPEPVGGGATWRGDHVAEAARNYARKSSVRGRRRGGGAAT